MNKRICVIGGGAWGENHIRTLKELGMLSAVVETDDVRRNYIEEKYHCICYKNTEEAVTERYDGYVVAAPAELHFKIGRKLLLAGLPTLIEKPMTLNSQDAMELVSIAERGHVPFMVAHILLFHPAINKIKELIDSGKIGKLFYLYSTRIKFGVVRTEENVFWSFAPHDLAVLDYLVGAPANNIRASKGNFLQDNICDYATAELDYPNNVKAHIFTSWLHPFKEQRLVVVGSDGMLWFNDATDKKIYFSGKRVGWESRCPVLIQSETEEIPYKHALPLTEELKYFANHLQTEPSISTGKDGYRIVKMLEEVQN